MCGGIPLLPHMCAKYGDLFSTGTTLPVIILQPTNPQAYLVSRSLITSYYFKINATVMHLFAPGKVMW